MPIESTQHWVREMGANLEILPENLEIRGKPKSNSEYLQFLIRIPWASLRPLQARNHSAEETSAETGEKGKASDSHLCKDL
jgi:hypothetical protein